MDIVKERSTAYISCTFKDKAGVVATPLGVTYSTRDKASGTAIKTNIPVTPNSTVEITLDAADSTIIDANNDTEEKVLVVRATFGVNDECNDEYTWTVQNLGGV